MITMMNMKAVMMSNLILINENLYQAGGELCWSQGELRLDICFFIHILWSWLDRFGLVGLVLLACYCLGSEESVPDSELNVGGGAFWPPSKNQWSGAMRRHIAKSYFENYKITWKTSCPYLKNSLKYGDLKILR